MAWPTSFPPLGLGVAGAALAGAGCVQVFPALPHAALSAGVLVLGAMAWRIGGWRRLAGAFLLALAWTCLVAGCRLQAQWPADAPAADAVVEGRVVGLPERGEHALHFEFEVERAMPAVPIGAGSRVRLGWYGPAPRELAPGSRWRLPVRLRPVRALLNPGGRDGERRAFAQAVAATGNVRDGRDAVALAGGQGIDRVRDSISASIGVALPAERGRFVRALAVGDTRGLADADWEVLRATGLTHQIAISGFHVGLVAGLGALVARLAWWLVPALGRRWPRPQAAALGAFALALGYTALAGFALPTVRTLLMIGVLLATRLARRAAAARAGFALALLGVLAFDPLAVLAAGFWLSFAGVGWLMWCLPRTGELGVGRLFLRAQLVSVVGLLPLTVWFFGQASLPGPLANLLGVPVISLVVVPLALAGVAIEPLHPGLAAGCWQASATAMDWLWHALEAIAAWPAALAWFPEPAWVAMALALAGAAWCLLPAAVPDRWLASLLFLPLLWPRVDLPPPGAVDVQVLDVGQGLAVLVSTHAHRVLYDVGAAGGRGPDRGETVVVPALRALGVSKLDLIVVSHDSRDHAGGLEAVLRAWPGTRVIGPEGWARPGMGLCEAGARWRWDGVDFRILHPPPDFPHLGRDASCVLRVAANGHAALLPGDIGEVVQRRLVSLHGASLVADVVIAPRHGAAGGADADFVAASSPRWVVFSTGAGNRAALPKPEALEAWTRHGAAALVTEASGSVRFRLGADAGTRAAAVRRLERRRYWRGLPGPGSGYASGHATTDR